MCLSLLMMNYELVCLITYRLLMMRLSVFYWICSLYRVRVIESEFGCVIICVDELVIVSIIVVFGFIVD